MSSTAISLVELTSEHTLRQDAFIRDGTIHDSKSTTELAPRAAAEHNQDPPIPTQTKLRGGKAVLVSLQLSLSTCANSFTTGMVVIGIVNVTADLKLDPSLVYWPVLAYNLTSSPLLVPFGAIADVFGARPLNLLGTLTCGIFILACGLSQNGNELIAFRCLHGVASALFLPTSMSIISTALAGGKIRNFALASLGLSMILGYGLGLVLGGVLIDTIGWRFGYFLCAGAQFIFFILGSWTIPVITPEASEGSILQRLRTQLDWVGALISCSCVGMLSYVLAMIAQDPFSMKQPLNITLLVASVLLIPAFVGWMRHQGRHGKPALMPGSLWKRTFTSICLVVAFANAEMQCMELLVSLFFQNVQSLSPLQSSLRILPGIISAALINLVTGQLVHKFTISWMVAIACIISGGSPLLMAITNPSQPYWYEAFPAQVLYPFCIDFVYVVSAIVITDSFPTRDQAMASAVFNTIANLGQSLGLAFVAIITNVVTLSSDAKGAEGLLDGYRAGFWTAFASMFVTAGVGLWGLRKLGTVGVKRD